MAAAVTPRSMRSASSQAGLGLVPAAEAEQVVGGVDEHEVPERAAHAEPRGGALAGHHRLQRGGVPPAQAQELAEVHVRARRVLAAPRGLERPAHLALARAGVAEEGEHEAEREPRRVVALRERGLAADPRLLPAAQAHQGVTLRREQARALRTRLGGQEHQRLLVARERGAVVPRLVLAEALVQARRPCGLRGDVEPLEGIAAERERSFAIAVEPRGLRRARQQLDAVDTRPHLGDIPQLERPLEVLARLRIGIDGLRLHGGGDRRGERGVRVAGALPLVGEPRRGGALRGQRLGERAMQLGSLAGDQRPVDDLADQPVPQRDGAVGLDHQAGVARLAQRRPELGHARLQHRVIGRAAGGREHRQQPLRLGGQALDAREHRVGDGVGHEIVAPGGEQLLHEERIAARAGVQLVGEARRDRAAGDRLELERDGVAVERGEVHAA